MRRISPLQASDPGLDWRVREEPLVFLTEVAEQPSAFLGFSEARRSTPAWGAPFFWKPQGKPQGKPKENHKENPPFLGSPLKKTHTHPQVSVVSVGGGVRPVSNTPAFGEDIDALSRRLDALEVLCRAPGRGLQARLEDSNRIDAEMDLWVRVTNAQCEME